MNWSELLRKANIPDSPGRAEAVAATLSSVQEKARLLAMDRERKASKGKQSR